MDMKKVKDIMVPLDDYAVVPQEATLLDAVLALDRAQERLPAGRDPHRAVLVVDEGGHVIGKVGQWSFLKSLEPKYKLLGDDVNKLAVAGVSDEFLASTMEHFRFFQDSLNDLCFSAYRRPVTEVMRPVAEYIEASAGLCDAIHLLVLRQTLSVIVRDNDKIVGLLRLSDLYHEIARQMKQHAAGDRSTQQET